MRRRFGTALAIAAGVACASVLTLAQSGAGGLAAPPALKVHAIRDGRLYWVEGGGGNSGIVIGDRGVIVIDAKTTEAAAKQLVTEVAKLTPKPVTHVIITHSDGDHANGIVGFPANAQVIAHVNNRNEQRATFLYAAVEIDGGRCLPPADRLPTQVVVQDKVVTRIQGVNFVLHHFAPAHTSGDLVVELPDDRIAFTGDLITSTVLVHTEKAGSLDGWFINARALLGLPVDSYVGGHATALDTKESLQKRMADYQSQRDKVESLARQGQTVAQIKAAMGDPPRNASGCRGIPYLSFAEVAYQAYTDRAQELK